MVSCSVIAIALFGFCLIPAGLGEKPTTLQQCVDDINNATRKADWKAKKEAFKTCVQTNKCFPDHPKSKQHACFETEKSDMKAIFESDKTQVLADKPAFVQCLQSKCSSSPLPEEPKKPHTGPRSYNASSKRDQEECKKDVLRLLAKHQRTPISDSDKTAIHACVDKCKPAGSKPHDSTKHEGGKKHHKRRHHSCLHEFCTRDNFKDCATSSGLAALHQQIEQEIQKNELAEFTKTCTCLQGAGVTTTTPAFIVNYNCNALPTQQDCEAIWADKEAEHAKHEAEKAAKSG